MKIIKKDFVNENTFSYCGKGRVLSSGTAYYMESESGKIYYGGRRCAELHGKNDLRVVPDLTKSLVSLGSTSSSSRGRGSRSDKINNEKNKSAAITYLLLRQECLSDFKLKGKPLSVESYDEHYRYYIEHNDLTEEHIERITRWEQYAVKNINSKLSLKNLSTCHAYQFILDRVEEYLYKNEKEDGIKFVQSLRSYLFSNCLLTPKQVQGLRNWVQYLPQDLREAKIKDFENLENV